jgi:hypothetical protein
MKTLIALDDTERFVALENIKRFRRRLENEMDPCELEKLKQLLRTEEAKLEALKSTDLSQAMPGRAGSSHKDNDAPK